MKLINHTLSYLSIALFVIIGVWAIVFYINILDEIYDSIDDGLENSKLLIIEKIRSDSSLIHKTDFMESNYAIHEISSQRASHFRDVYMDSTFYMKNEEDYEPVRILKTAFRAVDGKYYELQIVSSMVEEDDLIEDLFYSIIWLYVILLASIMIINNFLLKRIWKPFYEILNKLKNFNLTNYEDIPAIKTKVTEFNKLSEVASSLLQRTAAAFNSQKQFIENASHELQTPLAISVNKLELLAEKHSFSDDQLHDIGSAIQSLERLARLNKTLLLLSKIENRQFTEQMPVNFNELIDRLVVEFSDLTEFKSVTVSTVHEENLVRTLNPELAGIMVSNLLKNAIIHNRNGGSVLLKINSSRIIVENTGTSSALDQTRIFERFYKESSSTSSTGLGLAIVKSIADYYGHLIKYAYNGKHAFSIIVKSQN